MARENQKVRGWQVSVIAVTSALFILAIPSLGKANQWTYWWAGFISETIIILFVLRPTQPDED